MKQIYDLTKEEIIQIVNDIFSPKKITNIKIHKRDEEIICTIYTEWETYDDNGNREIDLIPDTLTLRNPFEYGEDAIEVNFSVGYDDYLKLKQFCFAKGIFHENWIKDNPYLQKELPSRIIAELEKIKQMTLERQGLTCDCNCNRCGWFPCADIGVAKIVKKDIKIIDKRIAELKGEQL